MIDIWIKTKVIDKCFDILFNGIFKNFQIVDRSINLMEVGTFCDIRLIVDGRALYMERCKIIQKNGNTVIVICEDYEDAIFFVIENGSVISIYGNPAPLKEWFNRK